MLQKINSPKQGVWGEVKPSLAFHHGITALIGHVSKRVHTHLFLAKSRNDWSLLPTKRLEKRAPKKCYHWASWQQEVNRDGDHINHNSNRDDSWSKTTISHNVRASYGVGSGIRAR